jgi:hemerythrin-like metal-binding protein
MQSFKWTKAHAVFLPQVDAEHRNLYRLAEDLHLAVESGAKPARVQDGMRLLIEGLDEHFSHEERLMKSAGCESYEWHKRQHDTLRRRAKRCAAAYAKGDRTAPETFLGYLAGWFRDHVSMTDRMMSSQLRNRDRLSASAS